MGKMIAGTPLLTLLVIGVVGFWVYRFWTVGWLAWTGNLRLTAICAILLGLSALATGPLWTFGIRSRGMALIVAVVGTITFLIFNGV